MKNALRRGDSGVLVEQLQHRLIVHGESLAPYGADGDFGDNTEKAVKHFQQTRGLVADGVAGPKTWEQLDKEDAKRDPDDDSWIGGLSPHVEHPDGPPEPPFAALRGNAGRAAVFGRFGFKAAPTKLNPEAIAYTDHWPDKNIVGVHVPQIAAIPGIQYHGQLDADADPDELVGRGPRLVSVHRAIRGQLVRLWQAWEDEGLLDRVTTWAGMWSPRFIRGSRSVLSNHAWATAFDINAPWNGLGAEPAKYGARGCVRDLVPLAHEHGFYWGGHFKGRPDGMHFEAAVVMNDEAG